MSVMAFTRIRTIKGHDYLYLEERWRENGKMCSRSTSLGPVGGTVRQRKRPLAGRGEYIAANCQHEQEHFFDMEILGRQAQEIEQQKTAKIAALHAELHERYGFILGPRIPVPIEKPIRNDAFLNAQPATDQQDAPPDVSGEAEAQ